MAITVAKTVTKHVMNSMDGLETHKNTRACFRRGRYERAASKKATATCFCNNTATVMLTKDFHLLAEL